MLFSPAVPDALTPRLARRLTGTATSLTLHLAFGLAIAWAAGRMTLPTGGGDPAGTIVMVHVGDAIPFNSPLSSAPSAGEPAPDDLGIRVGQGASKVAIPGFSFDYSVIANRPTLLLLLDKVAQGSYDALATLLDTDPATDLARTRKANRFAYDMLVTIRDASTAFSRTRTDAG